MLLSNGVIANTGADVAVPQSLAEFSPQLERGWYYPQSMGVELESGWAFYHSLYRYQPWVRTVVDKVANAVARLSINVWEIDNSSGKETRTLDPVGPYARLISSPSTKLSPYNFWLWLTSTFEIYGEAFLLKVRDANGRPTELLPMHPSRVAITRDPDTGKVWYIWTGRADTGGVGIMAFPEDDVIPFRLYSPLGEERGLSRLDSLRSTLFSEDASRTATAAMWRNAGMPNFMVSSPKPVKKDVLDRLKAQFDSLHAGARNAGKTAILEDGMSVTQLQLTAVEMQFIQSRQINREEVCGVYDVAPPIVQILDRATFSNITAQMRAFYRDTMAPRLELIESVLDHHLGDEFNLNKRATFAVSDVLRGDYETRANAVAQLVQVGVMSPAEGRELMELGDAGPVADKLYANSAIQPLGAPPIKETEALTGVVGNDPFGVAGAVTQVPSPAGGAPIAVPKPAAPKPDLVPTNPPPPQAQKYVRAVKGAVGRGEEIREFAMKLAAKYPDDLDDILQAVHIAIEERSTHADH
ncbi:phage portal protein [Gordonia sp. N1V]|uniref:phage portal protein n=1 Tax=Gordonia sp. N1V TaxID=3034163 RepID=UPI0023E1B9DC|nr:phage portal protein [Gordonia sp. N1V]MDF3280915.1 phage portal protein [Gordonia sp. N1V]